MDIANLLFSQIRIAGHVQTATAKRLVNRASIFSFKWGHGMHWIKQEDAFLCHAPSGVARYYRALLPLKCAQIPFDSQLRPIRLNRSSLFS